MKRALKNPNNHKKVTPSTKGKKGDDTKFTSYDTEQPETSTPQRARQSRESSSELAREKKASGKEQE